MRAFDAGLHHPPRSASSAEALRLLDRNMTMTDQLFDDYRRIWESLLTVQQDLLRQWQRVALTSRPIADGQAEREKELQRRWRELVLETLNKHRELVDSTYRFSNEIFEKTLHIADARSPDEYRQAVDDLCNQAFIGLTERSEARLRDFYHMAGAMYELSRRPSVG
jgi:hypothetical protein